MSNPSLNIFVFVITVIAFVLVVFSTVFDTISGLNFFFFLVFLGPQHMEIPRLGV